MKVGVGLTTKESDPERLAVGIASQKSSQKSWEENNTGTAAGVGAAGRVPSLSIHGASP